jgi:hypothetical protein
MKYRTAEEVRKSGDWDWYNEYDEATGEWTTWMRCRGLVPALMSGEWGQCEDTKEWHQFPFPDTSKFLEETQLVTEDGAQHSLC